MGANGTAGASVVAATEPEPAGANCAGGGVKFSYGVDDNGNGTLDAGEVDGTSYICNGGAGHETLVTTTPEPAGQICPSGGIKVEHGVDDNDNGMLDASEVDDTDYLCSPSQTLISTADEPVGGNCPNGGKKITSGLDDNGNGTLDAGEVDDTEYVCSGSNSLVLTSFEPPGMNCNVGGTRVQYGVDDNGNSVLDTGEVDGASYVCEPGQLFSSLPGPAPSGNVRSAGGGCGTRITTGGASVILRRMGALTKQGAGNGKFLIFDHAAADALVYQSPVKALAADGAVASWKYSDLINFTLVPNHSYCLVMSTDVSADYPFDTAIETAAGITSNVNNPNLNGNFAAPAATGGHASADCGIQVITY